MSGGRSFRSLFMVASCAGAALGCYLVSLRVASERAALEAVETQIVLAQRDLRVLETEIGTRGRLAQLERWNVKVLALSAPSADQFLGGSFELARLAQPERRIEFDAPVVLATAPAPQAQRPPIGAPATDVAGKPVPVARGALLHEASLKIETREVPTKPVGMLPQPTGRKSADKPAAAARPVDKKPADMPGLATAQPPSKSAAKKSVDNPSVAGAKPVTKPVRLATVDPLAPLPEKRTSKPSKDSAPAR